MLDFWNRKHTNPEGKNQRKPMKWIVIDSAIIGLIAMVACMPDVVPTLNEVWVMGKAFIGAFVVQLAIERGIKRG